MPCCDCKETSLSRVQFNLRQRFVLWLKENCKEGTTELSERQLLTSMEEIPLGRSNVLKAAAWDRIGLSKFGLVDCGLFIPSLLSDASLPSDSQLTCFFVFLFLFS